MTRVQVQLELPDSVAQEASARGILSPERLQALVCDALRQDAAGRWLETAQTLQASFAFGSEEEAEAFVQEAIDEARGRSRPASCA